MEKNLYNERVILITGASGGIGFETALYFANRGDKVAFHYNHNQKMAERAMKVANEKGLTLHCYQGDLTKSEAVNLMFDAIEKDLGPVEILINALGYSEQNLFQDITNEAWHKTMAVNVDASFYTARRATPQMLEAQKGVIVNLSSIWGIVGGAMEVHYSAAKGALIAMTKALAKELGPSGIRVNCLAPGWIETPMNESHDDEAVSEFLTDTPLGRLGSAKEIASWLYFLCSDEASFMTGQVISPNGGVVI